MCHSYFGIVHLCYEVKLINPLYFVDDSTVICWMSPYVILGVSGLFYRLYSFSDGNPVSRQCRP